METNRVILPGDPLDKAAKALLDAAYAYWKVYQEHGCYGNAVVWLTDEYDNTVIFTRGEYRQRLLHAAHVEGCEMEPFTWEATHD